MSCMICMICMIGMICMIEHMFSGMDLYCAYPAQHLIGAGEDLDDLDDLMIYEQIDRDLSEVW